MANVVGKSVAILEADNHYRKILTQYCESEGFGKISEYSSPEQLTVALAREEFDLFIIDWNIKGDISGAGVLNRLRKDKATALTPILVFSGVLEEDDLTLANEFFCTEFLPKPASQTVFKEKLKAVESEYLWYQTHSSSIESVFQTKGEHSFNADQVVRLLENAPNPVPMAALLTDVFMERKLYQAVSKLQRTILAVDSKNARALSYLGKVALINDRPSEAYFYLKSADRICPHNLERICEIGQIELEERKANRASETFDRGLAIDKDSVLAKAGKVVAENLMEYLGEKPPSVIEPLACLMNCIGISKVHRGKIADGIHHYKSALNFLMDSENKTKVMFNIGYGYFRQSDYNQAINWFSRAYAESDDTFEKAQSYAQRVQQLIIGVGAESIKMSDHDDLDDAYDAENFVEVVG